MSTNSPSTAGRGDPYWYEWLVGVAEVVRLLDPDSELLSVTFQVRGIKGWDDVVVRLKNGRRRCYQVKHTRVADNLTFGDLVQLDEDKNSLLGSLFKSWKDASLNDGLTTCIVYTNREAGQRASNTKGGVHRPPLLAFVRWLSGALPSANSIDELIPEAAWLPAWNEWRAQLAGSPEEQLAFLRAFEVHTNQDDLDGLVGRVTTTVATAFGVSEERAAPLVDALHRALRKWTTNDVVVTVEELCSELALEAEPKDLAPAPPPPAPFFPSRVPVAEVLEQELAAEGAEPVFFLTAEPGAGKTSVLSWLANRRTDTPFTGRVALRFFCFEPIRPETPFISPDASRVRPRDLWFSLLTQLREGLRGRLYDLKVPLRNDLLTWQEARSHVLRLASHIGGEQKRPFVIVIDGIDHAARAAQTMPDQVAEFFASLPGPSELNGKNIRLLVAGQPAESYAAQYPSWLVAPNAGVKKIGLNTLTDGDVRALYQASPGRIPVAETDAAVRLIQQFAKGNTLATVFAVAEAERLGSVEDLAQRLAERRLADGLSAYYSAIWRHALHDRGEAAEVVEDCLVAALSLARRGVTPDFLASAFSEWSKPPSWWELVLEALGPLLTRASDGYRVRHNDIRIFLSGKSGGWSPIRRRRVAGQLADYYRRPESDRAAAHLQLLDLLALAERSTEFARLFTVDWVIEAGAVGVESEQLVRECREAARGLQHLRDWSCVVSVACAVQTLERLLDERRYGSHARSSLEKVLPPFLPTEASVRPLSNWSVSDLLALARDVGQLIDSGETDRATALLRRWLDGLDFDRLVAVLPNLSSKARFPDADERLEQEATTAFEALGEACGRAGWVLRRNQAPEDSDKLINAAHFVFERGVVSAMLKSPIPDALTDFFSLYTPTYRAGWEETLRGLARAGRWQLVKEMLAQMASDHADWNTRVRAEAVAWALRSGAAEQDPVWLSVLSESKYGIDSKDNFHSDSNESLSPYLGIAYALGWTRLALDSRDIADGVYRNYDPDNRFDDSRAPTLAVFRASALLGRIERFTTGAAPSEAKEFVTAAQVGEILRVLWGEVVYGNRRFDARSSAAQLANNLAEAVSPLGGDHAAAVLEQAAQVAAKFPVDARMQGVWRVLSRHGRRDLQRRWLSHWLAPDGAVWKLSHDEVHGIVSSLLPLANEVGEATLAEQASSRLGWLLVGYSSHKEYGFSDVFEWFQLASRQSPTLWRTAGWRLWTACDACDARGGDNRLEDDIRTAVSAAALRCGVTDWWTLIQTTLAENLGGHWHNQTRQYLVEAAIEAIDAGGRFQAADQPLIWSLALAFSYWHDEGDNHALQRFRDALLQSTNSPSDQKPLRDALARTTRSASLERRNPNERRGEAEKPDLGVEERSSPAASAAELIRQGNCVPPSTAAAAIRAAVSGGTSSTCDIPTLLSSLGVSHFGDWTQSDDDVPASLDAIVSAVPDEALWFVIPAIGKRFDQQGEYPVYGVASNLLTLALARAKAHGLSELVKGLEIQLDMHARWGRSGSDLTGGQRPPLETHPQQTSWRTVAVKLMGPLFSSWSAEVLTAALEGAHALVAADPSVVSDLVAELSTEWQRYWFLHAAECWAVLHPEALGAIRPSLMNWLSQGSLVERIQSWIVLCNHADATDSARPEFPLPPRATRSLLLTPGPPALLETPGIPHGLATLSDSQSAVRGMILSLLACGLDFTDLEPQVANALGELQQVSTEVQQSRPHRYEDFYCHNLRSEEAVGRAILPALSSVVCNSSNLPYLAQGFLDNDDPWLQRCPPRRASNAVAWPAQDRYDQSSAVPESDVRRTLLHVATSLDVPPGWRTFAARVFFCTGNRDFVLDLWYESHPKVMLLSAGRKPSTPSGRTFLWWLGTFFEPALPRGVSFVSGLFVGGRQRLNHDHLEILPPKQWRDRFSWLPDRTDPLTWRNGGERVAYYDRVHGPLRDMPQSPNHRQPLIDRWVISDAAFAQVENAVGPLRQRQEFESEAFREE